MINLTKNYAMKTAEKLLCDLKLYRSSLNFYKGILECDSLPEEKYKTAQNKIKYIEHILSAADKALELLDETERKIITNIYFRKEELYDVCEECSLERSSIYRYRTSALKKIAKAVYGIDENMAV